MYKAVLKLVSGTALAQLLMIAALPILSRLYSPQHFESLAVFISIFSILSVISCLRFDLAIPLPRDEEHAKGLAAVSLISAITISFTIFALLLIFGDVLASLVNDTEVGKLDLLYLVPLGLLGFGIFSIVKYQLTRSKDFGLIAKLTVITTAAGLSFQVVSSFYNSSGFNLILGQLVIYSSGALFIFRNQLSTFTEIFRNVDAKNKLLQIWYEYRYFPKYSVAESLTNNMALQLPVLIIANYAIGPEAGFLMLATKILGAPVTLLGGALAQVYLSHGGEYERNGTLANETYLLLKRVALLGTPLVVAFTVVVSSHIELILGDRWAPVGEMLFWLLPWYLLKFMSSPISMVMSIRMLQKRMLILTTFGLVLRMLFTGGFYLIDKNLIVLGYALSGAVFYFLAFWLFTYAAGMKLKEKLKVGLYVLLGFSVGLTLGKFANVILEHIGL